MLEMEWHAVGSEEAIEFQPVPVTFPLALNRSRNISLNALTPLDEAHCRIKLGVAYHGYSVNTQITPALMGSVQLGYDGIPALIDGWVGVAKHQLAAAEVRHGIALKSM
jgi:hypothetical protein